MSEQMNPNVTQLLQNWNNAPQAEKQLSPILYEAMLKLSQRYIQREQHGYTLQATELVHETYLKLVDSDISWQSRKHFYAIAATTMRRLLVDRARKKQAEKHGGIFQRITFIEGDLSQSHSTQHIDNILALNESLDALQKQDERKALIVQLSFFAGLSYPEIALCLGLSEATVERDMRFSKAWLAANIETL